MKTDARSLSKCLYISVYKKMCVHVCVGVCVSVGVCLYVYVCLHIFICLPVAERRKAINFFKLHIVYPIPGLFILHSNSAIAGRQ